MRSGKSRRSREPTQAEGQHRKIGRPRIIEGPEEMDRRVEEYVTKCLDEKAPMTLTGMILHLGLSSRQSLDRYADRPEFCDSVKRAKTLVEQAYEERLHGTTPTGAIFALKNMGWSDRVELTGTFVHLDVNALSDDQVRRLAAGEHYASVLGAAYGPQLLPAGSAAANGEQGSGVDGNAKPNPDQPGERPSGA